MLWKTRPIPNQNLRSRIGRLWNERAIMLAHMRWYDISRPVAETVHQHDGSEARQRLSASLKWTPEAIGKTSAKGRQLALAEDAGVCLALGTLQSGLDMLASVLPQPDLRCQREA
jgi:hypothetical protein